MSAATRYMVEWADHATALAAAKSNGMPDDGAIGDWVSLDGFDREAVAPSFAAAVAKAREVLPLDLWSCPRIRRQVLVPNDTDDLGNRVAPMPDYETEATWEVFDDEPDPLEEKPDWTE